MVLSGIKSTTVATVVQAQLVAMVCTTMMSYHILLFPLVTLKGVSVQVVVFGATYLVHSLEQ